MNTNKLKTLVDNGKFSKVEISDMCNISRTTLDNVLSGADAKVSTIEALAKCFGVSVGYLFEDEECATTDNEVRTKLYEAEKEIEILKRMLESSPRRSTRVVVELDVDDDEFIKMGLKDKVIQVLNK